MNDEPHPSSPPILGILALFVGITALGLAIIPRAVFDVPPPWPAQPSVPPPPQTVVDGGTSFEVKGVKVTIGGKSRVVQPPAPEPPAVPTIARTLAITTAVVALLGAVFSSLACWRERSYVLAVPGAGMCCAALLWHYILYASHRIAARFHPRLLRSPRLCVISIFARRIGGRFSSLGGEGASVYGCGGSLDDG